MNYLISIKNLIEKRNSSNSLSEKKSLDDEINNWIFDLIHNKIRKIEEKLSTKEYLISGQDLNPNFDSEYGRYTCHINWDKDRLEIRHYCCSYDIWRDIDIPLYILEDIEGGLKKYYKTKYDFKQKEILQDILQDILQNLKQIKNSFCLLGKDIPEEFKKIIDNDFWELI